MHHLSSRRALGGALRAASMILLLVACGPPPMENDAGPDASPEGDSGPGCVGPGAAETCNGVDDDCDNRVDEEPESLCPGVQSCEAGACTCTMGEICGPDCVDVQTDASHCGRCDNACGAGDVCLDGGCCTPSSETCNGADDDCDGMVDEGSGADVGCADGISCVAGACECEAANACGGTCVDTQTDDDHCGECGNTCGAGQTCSGGRCCGTSGVRVDMLFMIDNSNSMTEEQANLTAALPNMVRGLATGDVDGDGVPEGSPVTDLHLGVVTSDMGTGGFTVPTCANSQFGDDGILRTQGRTDIPGCMATYPSFLAYDPASGTSPADVARDFACVATAGTGGCGFEQQLEAALKASTPSTSATRFFQNTEGNADVENAGFLRPDSLFVPVLLTDEDDCSASDPEIYNPSSAVYTGDLNLRCFLHRSTALHPVSRYVNGLTALRSDPRDVLYTVITGVPADLVAPGTAPDYTTILGDARMQQMIDPSQPTRLIPSCNTPGNGLAFPPRRIVETARDLEAAGARAVVGSICRTDYSDTLSELVRLITVRQLEVCTAP